MTTFVALADFLTCGLKGVYRNKVAFARDGLPAPVLRGIG